MRFEELPLSGAKLIHGVPFVDERGSFERIFAVDPWAQQGLEVVYPEVSLSYNAVAGTRRGLHFQRAPREETKIVRCVSGAAYDVIVDVRRASPTFGQHFTTTMKSDSAVSLYIPKGIAHGFQTLEDDTTLIYFISEPFSHEHSIGVASDDPALAIHWPAPAVKSSDRDLRLPLLAEIASQL